MRFSQWLSFMLIVAVSVLVPVRSRAAVFTVTSTGDGVDENTGDGICEVTDGAGDCTLRAAIAQAMAVAGSDEIHFNLAGTPPFTIQPPTELYGGVLYNVIIDGLTQPGASNSPSIVIDGNFLSDNGLWLGDNVTLRGLVIQRFNSVGVRMIGSGNVVEGCYLGTNAAGTAAAPLYTGILDSGSNNRIGGSAAGQGNLISGNLIGIEFNSANNTVVFGNRIGTEASGTSALSNQIGIIFSSDSMGNQVGGVLSGQGNVVSGNLSNGFHFYHLADFNTVQGNHIGTDASGDILIPNGSSLAGDASIVLSGAANIIGGPSVEAGNHIVGNLGAGVLCDLCGESFVQNNVIASNAGPGIGVDAGSSSVKFWENSIYDNDGLGVDLHLDGVTANDAGEADGVQNHPVLSTATTNGCDTSRVTGTLQSYAAVGVANYHLEFFKSPSADPSGFGEGKIFIGSLDLDLDDAGFAAFEMFPPANMTLQLGDVITATATEPYGSTSEFSAAIAATRNEDPGSISFAANRASATEAAGSVSLEIERTCGDFGAASVDVATFDGTALTDQDYEGVAKTVHFADGEKSKNVTIPIIDDALIEDGESFTVTLSNAVGASLGVQSQIAVDVADDDTIDEEPPAATGGSTGSGTTGGSVPPSDAGDTGGCSLVSPSALEVGPNDFRISSMGPEGDTEFGGYVPAVAYNDHDDEFFVIWAGNDDAAGLAPGEIEVYGQRIDALTGSLLGERVRLSDAGTDGSISRNVFVGQGMAPSIAYNSSKNEYLAVWASEDDFLAKEEIEIFGQRIDAATGNEIGDNDFQISRMGTNGDSAYVAYFPSAAYNSRNDEYLAVWAGVAPGQAVNAETELYGQRISSNGAMIGDNAVLRSPDAGKEEAGNGFVIYFPEVAYNSRNDEYLIVFNADLFADNDVDIFAQRVDGATAVPLGVEFRVSDMGTAANPGEPFGAVFAHVAYDQRNDAYLVVWQGSDTVDKEYDIYGQFLDAATDAEIGVDDFQISSMGPAGSIDFGALGFVDVAYNSKNGEYEVVWNGDHDQGGLIDDEFEIFSQRIDAATGAPIGGMERLSDLQGTGNTNGKAGYVAIAYNPSVQAYLTVWDGDDDVPPLVDGENEIFGQFVSDAKCGNGFIEGAEGCDDGNIADGDGCSATCVQEEAAGTTGGVTGGTTAGTTGADAETSGGCALVR